MPSSRPAEVIICLIPSTLVTLPTTFISPPATKGRRQLLLLSAMLFR
jgi:hypothetical protein